ncbi:TSCPD domain-containing protein [Clostridia bacterium]|nr:TSCPD domain-containing protein [Clostridia bacterium]
MTTFKTNGVCSKAIHFDTENGVVKSVDFEGGCAGNTNGISSLVVGMPIDDVIKKLSGIQCGARGTSCPDQLARALSDARR